MSNSNLLKEAIADAKAVRETAIANAKLALEQAFTPKLQNIISEKLNEELSDYDMQEKIDGVGYDDPTNADDAQISMNEDDDFYDDMDLDEIIKEIESDYDSDDLDEDMDFGDDLDLDEDMDFDDEFGLDEDMDFGDDLDLDEDMDFDDEFGLDEDMDFDDEFGLDEDMDFDDEFGLDEAMDFDDEFGLDEDMDFDDEFGLDEDMDFDDEFGLDEEYDDDYDLDENFDLDFDLDEDMDFNDELEESYIKRELDEAHSTIRKLRKTMNEVNLLNAKLLYANKIFKDHNLSNSQKAKIVESLDRTSNVKEVKLVYSTISESIKIGKSPKNTRVNKRNITENVFSRPMKSTAPKNIITEDSDEITRRFKQLAGITKKQ